MLVEALGLAASWPVAAPVVVSFLNLFQPQRPPLTSMQPPPTQRHYTTTAHHLLYTSLSTSQRTISSVCGWIKRLVSCSFNFRAFKARATLTVYSYCTMWKYTISTPLQCLLMNVLKLIFYLESFPIKQGMDSQTSEQDFVLN